MTSQWLIRKKCESGGQIELQGPVSKDELESRIKNGDLTADDEVCPEGGYWFALHEGDEVQRFLGVDLEAVSGRGQDEENTQPEILLDELSNADPDTVNAETTTFLARPGKAAKKPAEEPEAPAKAAGRPKPATQNRPALKSVSPASHGTTPQVHTRGAQPGFLERGRFLSILFFLGLGAVLAAVYSILQYLRQS